MDCIFPWVNDFTGEGHRCANFIPSGEIAHHQFVTGLQFGVRFPVPTEGLAELNGTSVQQNLLAILNDVTAKLSLLLISATLKATGCPQQVSCCHSLGEWVLPWTKHL